MRTALLLILLPGCFNPDDIFPVRGSITSAGSLAGQTVRLLRDADLESSQLGTCSEAKAFKQTTTDEAGNFAFDVFRAQAQSLTNFGQFCFRVETTFPSGTTAFSDLRVDREIDLPPFPDWLAQPTRSDGVLHFVPLVPLPAAESLEGDQLNHRAEWLTDDGGIAWVVDDRFLSLEGAPVRLPMAFDDAVLEDFAGNVHLSGRWTRVVESTGPLGGGGATTIEVRSGQTLRLAGTRVPVSRGLPCPDACPATDGDLTEQDAGVVDVTISLPTPRALSAVVVRGASSSGFETGPSLVGVLLNGADGGSRQLVPLPISLWSGGVPAIRRRPGDDGGIAFEPQGEQHYVVIPLDGGVAGSVSVGLAGGLERLSEISLVE